MTHLEVQHPEIEYHHNELAQLAASFEDSWRSSRPDWASLRPTHRFVDIETEYQTNMSEIEMREDYIHRLKDDREKRNNCFDIGGTR